MRYTEYHNGVAVIRDKSKHKEAMAKLAAYKDMEQNPVHQPEKFAKIEERKWQAKWILPEERLQQETLASTENYVCPERNISIYRRRKNESK